MPLPVAEAITKEIWSATKFLVGSTSKRIPYEIAHGLRLVLSEWTKKDVIVTTAITQDLEYSFYFQGVPSLFYKLVDWYLGVSFESELVQIALPEIYRHRPLYNVALYHELGHFLDDHHLISGRTLIMHPPATLALPDVDPAMYDEKQLGNLHLNHRMEFFADLFAASFAGRAYAEFLQGFAGDHPMSHTHPSTASRLQNIREFLNGKTNAVIDMFQVALDSQGLPNLAIRFSAPALADAFDNVRPFQISSDAEIHGILESGYEYLIAALARERSPWSEMDDAAIEVIVNDLVEKSIRNRMIADNWTSAVGRQR
ncbi:MAG: hypothetical protein ABL931_03385 [Usitatibacteraceae bacterium]